MNTQETTSASAVAETDGASRRGFLKIGAAVAVGLLGSCGAPREDAPGGEAGSEDEGGGGSGGKNGSGTGGKNGTGGSSSSVGGSTADNSAGSNASSSTAGSTGKGGATGGGAGKSEATGVGGKSGSDGSAGTSRQGSGGTTQTGGTTSAGGGGKADGSTGVGGTTGGSDGGTVSGAATKENTGASCSITNVPTFANAKANAKLPDPFKFINGTRISKKEDWTCLRAELSALLQACIYGPKMPPPDKLTATFSGGKLTVNMTVGSKTGSFSVSIKSGGTEAKPVPCLITCGGSSLPGLGVAQIDMANNSMAAESKTVASGGLVHTLYGNTASKSGSLIGWAWGLSRIIDGLELCPEAGINTKRIAVTGCSRNGKGALAMGAFDERVALTLVQEGGSGGTAAWRISAAEKKKGANIQESQEIIGEANWQGSDFRQYAQGQNDKLPADMHMAVAICAPRAILVLENDIDWLGPVATYGGGVAGAMVYEALGIKDRCGVSVAANHGHCQFPSGQQKYLDAFVKRFLKDQDADTSKVDELNCGGSTSKLGKFTKADWIDWEIPTLTGSLPFDPFA